MSAIFGINFRREAYRLELARTRRRMASVGGWVAYFGVLVVVFGLYGLNCSSLLQRTRLLEAQIAHARTNPKPTLAWKPATLELAQVERLLDNPRRWQVRLGRLAALLPPNARLSAVAVNPDNQADPVNRERLVITGVLKTAPGQDRMQGIMQLVATLRADPLFAAQYRTIKLAESRIGGSDVPAEFRIECR